jgi:DNA-binding beta-propeller fold protein YncE
VQAANRHVFLKTFAEPCIAEPCEGRLKKPAGVAVNEASGDIYVVDEGANRVVRFNKKGEYEPAAEGRELNGSGALPWEGTEAGAGGQPGETGGTGSLPGERGKATGRFSEPEGIAVDNTCALQHFSEPKCKEEDPSNGDVYVADAANRVVDKYDAQGKYLGQLSEAGGVSFANEGLDGVAVDPEGGVWVYREAPVLDGFTNALASKFTEEIVLGIPGRLPGFFGTPAGVAVDAEGDFYVGVQGGGIPRIAKLDHTGKVLTQELDKEDSSAVSVDQGTNIAFVENLTSVRAFTLAGEEFERLGEGQLSKGAGIGVDSGAGFLYVADAGSGDVAVFGPEPPTVPRIESESVADVSALSAELLAEINPRSEAGEALTEYHFQYGACASAQSCPPSPYQTITPIPDGQLTADFKVHAVSALITGLSPNTTYHFRVLAKNSHGEAAPGEERTFTTEGAGGQLTLPDDRGWELVSPPDKHGALIEPIRIGVVQAAASGGGITYLTNTPTEDEPQGYATLEQVLSSRVAAAWSSRDVSIPHAATTGFTSGRQPEDQLFNPELTLDAVQPFGTLDPQLSSEASEQTPFLHELSEGCGSACFRPLVTGKAPFSNVPEGTAFGEEEECTRRPPSHESKIVCGPEFLGASEDLSHVVLEAKVPLTESAQGRERELYEWAGGRLQLASVLPGGEPTPSAPSDSAFFQDARGSGVARRAISSDGSRIVFGTPQSPQALYLRDMARGETVQLDQATCGSGEGCESGAGKLQIASADGSRVLFSDERKLTADAGASPSEHESDLYECRIALVAEKLACSLSDLTPAQGGEGAALQGALLGASEDATVAYFVAEGVLSKAQNARKESATAGEANLYVSEEGQTRFIATLAKGDNHDWSEQPPKQPTRATGSGRYLELMSEARLTGYDNRDTQTGKPAAEVYLYDKAAGSLACASCVASGARPAGVEYEKLEPTSGGLAGGPRETWEAHAPVAGNVPGWTAVQGAAAPIHQPRYLLDSGRLFFNSADELVPQDTNATEDVYEYEPPGVGGCEESSESFSARSGGCVALISSGSSAQESAFMDASESGDDVFFLSSAKLSALDVDGARDIYDAHVCSASAPCITFPDVQSPPCSTEASCKASPTPQPSIFGAPASATFSGPGNLAPAPRPKEETKAQKLAKALKACRAKKSKSKRKACEKGARRKYGAAKAKKAKAGKKAKATRRPRNSQAKGAK